MSRSLCLIAVLALVASVHGYDFFPTSLKQREMTDACLSDVSKIATAVPKIIDDIQRGDMVSLMTDVMGTIPLFNQTRVHCSSFECDDMVNQTTKNNLMYCMRSFSPICDSIEVVLMDLANGKFTLIYDDTLLVLRNAAYSLRVCNNIADFIEYPKVIFNFFNSTQCWNSHQRSANLLHAISHDLQVGNYTDAVQLIFPFISATADSLRFCSVNTTNSSYINEDVQLYNFVDVDESTARKQECKVHLQEAIQALTSEPQDFGRVVDLVPKLKNCADMVDIAQMIKNPVIRRIVASSLGKSFN